MTHIMLDLETMGNSSNAAIVAIGAVKFDVANGITDSFYQKVDLESAVDNGGVMDPSTVIWWLGQNDAARKELQAPGCISPSILPTLVEFSAWLGDGLHARIWGNGAAFDNVILANAYKNGRMKAPWRHWNDRCYRTVKAMYLGVPKVTPTVAHHALADAEAQARHLIAIAKAHNLELL